MDALSHQFFSGSALSFDQDTDVCFSDFIDDRFEFIHLRAVGEKEIVDVLHGDLINSNLYAKAK
jgi:hypothetical protein